MGKIFLIELLQVQNVTRAGCEKANTGQFELLRVLGQVGGICKVETKLRIPTSGFIWKSVSGPQGAGQRCGFIVCHESP